MVVDSISIRVDLQNESRKCNIKKINYLVNETKTSLLAAHSVNLWGASLSFQPNIFKDRVTANWGRIPVFCFCFFFAKDCVYSFAHFMILQISQFFLGKRLQFFSIAKFCAKNMWPFLGKIKLLQNAAQKWNNLRKRKQYNFLLAKKMGKNCIFFCKKIL